VPDSQALHPAARPAAHRAHVWLTVLTVAGLTLRLALVQLRWINPDEGAHLMDAQLVMNGLLPEVDFGARQPFYVYALALWLQVTGTGFEGVRVLMAVLDTAVGPLLYAIGVRVLPVRSALVGAGLYLLLPFTIFWAPLVHTEPLTMVLMAAGLLGVVRRLTGVDSTLELAGAGASLALGCYVRQSALAGVLAAFTLLVLHRRPARAAVADCLRLTGGYVAIVAVMLAWYARRLTPAELWTSSVNPLHMPIMSLMRIVESSLGTSAAGAPEAAAGAAAAAAVAPAFRSGIQPWTATLSNLRGSLSLCALVVAACAAFLVYWAVLERRRAPEAASLRLAASVVLAWTGSLGLLYGYWIAHRGFYPQYAVELLPPMALGSGHALRTGWAAMAQVNRARLAAVAIGGVGVAILAHGSVPDGRYTSMAYALVAGALALAGGPAGWWRNPAGSLGSAAAAAALVWLVLRWILRAPLHPADGLAAAVGAVGLVVAARARWQASPSPLTLLGLGTVGALAIATAVFSARVLEPRYFCVWSPATLREVVALVEKAAPPDKPLMSGAVIWEFVTRRPPFGTISHPLAFQHGSNPAAQSRIDAALLAAPPAVIVLDGYTEATYLATSEAVTRAVRNDYEEVGVVLGSRYPVRVLKLRR
jgi:hypothetical protein